MKKGIAMTLAVLMLSGCAGAENNTENNVEITTSGEKDSLAGDAEENYIDYNVVCANINIDGEKYAMPFAFQDMKGFTCTESRAGNSDKYCMASIQNKDGKKLIIEIKDQEQNRENLSKKPITSVLASSYVKDMEGNYYYDELEEQCPKIDFNGVKLGMTLEELQTAWGVSDLSQDRNQEGMAYTYTTADQQITVQVNVDIEGKVYSIALVNHRI